MFFLIFPITAVLVLYLNIRKVATGNKGVLIAGLPIILTFASFFLARSNSQIFAAVQCFMVIWLCQALWMYLLWDLFFGVRFVWKKLRAKKGHPQYRTNFFRNGSRAILAATVLLTAGLLAYGIPNHYDYKTRTLEVPVTLHPSFVAPSSFRNFKAVFFSDLHIVPLFKKEKLERLIAQCDSIKPDFLLFGGDFADVHDSVLTAEGYDPLIQKLASTARIAAVAIEGNHEVYMERSGSDPAGFLRRNGWIVLDDSTACLPAEMPLACFTGRRDFQKARVFNEPRKTLEELAVGSPMAESLTNKEHDVPWILLDHQPKGIEEEYGKSRPDFALSGHTHDGQFFPGNILIKWIWPLAYGEGTLSETHWLVSSGVDSWGPPVRAGSDTEIWILDFKTIMKAETTGRLLTKRPRAVLSADSLIRSTQGLQKAMKIESPEISHEMKSELDSLNKAASENLKNEMDSLEKDFAKSITGDVRAVQ